MNENIIIYVTGRKVNYWLISKSVLYQRSYKQNDKLDLFKKGQMLHVFVVYMQTIFANKEDDKKGISQKKRSVSLREMSRISNLYASIGDAAASQDKSNS